MTSVAGDTAELLRGALRLAAPAPPAAAEVRPDPTRERVLDAALQLAAASGLRHLTMDDVAARAGVGRMTVYRRFGTRQALVDALTLREAGRCLGEIAGALDPGAALLDRMASLFTTTLRVINEHPLLARLARVEPQAIVHELTRNDSEVFRLVRDFLVGEVRAAQTAGELVPGDPEPLAELALRLGLSFVLIPGGAFQDDAETTIHRTLEMLLAPRAQSCRPPP